MAIVYKQGNLFEHLQPKDVIIHVVNDINRFGSGFAKAMAEFSPTVKMSYHDWFDDNYHEKYKRDWTASIFPPRLGGVQIIPNIALVPRCVTCFNMMAQSGVIGKDNPHPLDYNALDKCLQFVKLYTRSDENIVAPLFGAGLAGGDWNKIAPIVENRLDGRNVAIYVLNETDLPEKYRHHLIKDQEQSKAKPLKQYLETIKCDRCGGAADFLHSNAGHCPDCGDNICGYCVDTWVHVLRNGGEDIICKQCYTNDEVWDF